MEQETVTNPEPVAETSAPETEVTTNLEVPEEVAEQEQPEIPAPDADYEDMEWEGKSFKAPKGAKSAMMMHADYTQKTQKHADAVKQWQASIEANRNFTRDVGRLDMIDERLEQFSKVDWQAYNASNPQAAQAAYFEYQQLRDNRARLADDIQRRAAEQEATAEQETASRVSQAREALSKPDPAYGWDGKLTPEKIEKLDNFGRKLGYPLEQLARADARDVKTLHLAMLGLQTLEQQRALAKQPPMEAQPIPKVMKGRGNVVGNPNDMDMDRYAEWRKNGGGERRR